MLVLLVEDNPAEARLTQEALQETGFTYDLKIVSDGEMATQFLRKECGFSEMPTPNLILLDLNLPRKHGREVLQEIKSDPLLSYIPVIVVSNSHAPMTSTKFTVSRETASSLNLPISTSFSQPSKPSRSFG